MFFIFIISFFCYNKINYQNCQIVRKFIDIVGKQLTTWNNLQMNIHLTCNLNNTKNNKIFMILFKKAWMWLQFFLKESIKITSLAIKWGGLY
jgi:hypothetical protein